MVRNRYVRNAQNTYRTKEAPRPWSVT